MAADAVDSAAAAEVEVAAVDEAVDVEAAEEVLEVAVPRSSSNPIDMVESASSRVKKTFLSPRTWSLAIPSTVKRKLR